MASIGQLKVDIVVSVTDGSLWSRFKAAAIRLLDRIARRRTAPAEIRVHIHCDASDAIEKLQKAVLDMNRMAYRPPARFM